MTTLQQVVDATFRRLGQRPTMNLLDGSLADSGNTVTLTYDVLPGQGDRLAVGLEDMHVWSVSGKTCTCRRGMGGSTAAAADDETLVYIDPEFSPFEIQQAVNDVLTVLPGMGVFQFKTVDLAADSSVVGYDLSSVGDLLRVQRVAYESPAGDDNWPVLNRRTWSVQQKASTDDFASGEALFLYDAPYPSATVRVLYQAPFSALSALSSDVETVAGLPAHAHPLLSVGAAYRLLLGRAPSRASMESQGDSRRPEEVSATDSRTSLGALYQEWLGLVAAAKRDQTRKYGVGA